jgi:[ribosomal protein S5]-alanine N-acetyltransferase
MRGPVLDDGEIQLVPPPAEFARLLAAWYSDPAVTRYLNLRFPPTVAEEEAWVEQLASSNTDVVWAIARAERPIGIMLLKDVSWRKRSAHLGIGIGESAEWGHGYGTRAVRLCTSFDFRELGLEKVMASVFVENVASRRMMEKAGYRQFGLLRHDDFRDGRWHDTWLCDILRDEWLATGGGAT